MPRPRRGSTAGAALAEARGAVPSVSTCPKVHGRWSAETASFTHEHGREA